MEGYYCKVLIQGEVLECHLAGRLCFVTYDAIKP